MKFIALILSALCLIGLAFAQQTSPSAGNVSALRSRAEAGDANAQVDLGLAYRLGEIVEKNYAESMTWYAKAAKQGNANAMFNVATFYYNGDAVKIDDIQAYAWFSLAARSGSKKAEEAVARMSLELTSQKLSEANLLAADMLAEGSQVPRDTTAALATYDEAGKSGRPEVQVRLAKVFMNGWGIARDGAKAETHCRKALTQEKEYTPALLCLAYLNQSGLLGPNRGAEALGWYEKALKLGSPVAAYGLGVAYATGNGTKQDFEKALLYLVIASLSKIEVAVPLAQAVEQRLPPQAAQKLIKKANEQKTTRNIYAFGIFDRQFSYVVKVDQLP
jgi:TPR repeat protein